MRKVALASSGKSKHRNQQKAKVKISNAKYNRRQRLPELPCKFAHNYCGF